MLTPTHPAIRLHIRPHFSPQTSLPSHLLVTYTLPIDSSLSYLELHYPLSRGNTPTHPFDPSTIFASDDRGPVPLAFSPSPSKPNTQIWRPERNLEGQELKLCMNVYPREVDASTPLGSRIDMRKDHEGFVGTGMWFLPLLHNQKPVAECQGQDVNEDEDEDSVVYTNVISWDLSLSPSTTRAVSTHGEGPSPVFKLGNQYTLVETFFMLGPVQSYPPLGAAPSACTTYHLSPKLPRHLHNVRTFNASLFRPFARMIGIDPQKETYAVFYRNVVRGFGGLGGKGSFILDYDESVEDIGEDELKAMFVHEMTHGFAALMPEDDGDANLWYAEGLAEWYACILPYRFDIEDESCAINYLNHNLSGYYTSPMRHVPMKDAVDDLYDNWYAEKIPYFRGFAYFAAMDSRLRRVTGMNDPRGLGPMDEIIIGIEKMRRKGEKVGQQDWLSGLGKWLEGRFDYESDFRRMLAGKGLIDLEHASFLSPRRPFDKVKQRVLEIGFDLCSSNRKVVNKVVEGSAAEVAGLRAGDHVVATARLSPCYGDPDLQFWLDVSRDGRPKRLTWTPQAREEVVVWQLARPRRLED